MNRILFHHEEIGADGRVITTGRKATHIRSVLHGQTGQSIRIGIINGARGSGLIREVNTATVTLDCVFDQPPPARASIDLLLALPRPKVIKRLWAPLASIGLDRIFITNGAKVERCYFDTHWLEPAFYEQQLIEGLEQSEDTNLPVVTIHRRLKPFLEDELDILAPPACTLRLLGHPTGHLFTTFKPASPARRILVAIGPEGGWTDFEIDLLNARGFSPVSLGWRKLRSDTACVALLTMARMILKGE